MISTGPFDESRAHTIGGDLSCGGVFDLRSGHCDQCAAVDPDRAGLPHTWPGARPSGHHLVPIPDRIRTRGPAPEFCHWKGRWAVVGPDHALPEHGQVEVRRRTGDPVTVTIGRHVAERVVAHRLGSYTRSTEGDSTRYVVAEIATERVQQGKR